MADSLYELASHGYSRVNWSVWLLTNDVPYDVPLDVAALQEPTNAGYARIVRLSMNDLIEDIRTVSGFAATLMSKVISWQNESSAPVAIKGIALTVQNISGQDCILAVVRSPITWTPGARIGGRLHVHCQLNIEA